jgi:dienelactone hydrolase
MAALALGAAGLMFLGQTVRAELPADVRLKEPKDLNGYFGFTPPSSMGQWLERAAYVKRQILVSQGLWPLPTRTPLNTEIYGRIDEGDYTVEKVTFESFPGFFVTGSLYRPKNVKGKIPGIVCPHGHWREGRFYDHQKQLPGDIIIGAERFENGGRNHIQARCVTLARMGCVAFAVDMVGYADSKQLSYDLVHRFKTQRPDLNKTKDWGFFSPQAEANVQNVMGVQTWNGIRCIDFLLSLPEVDAKRIGVTGASGGGTQTMLLGAVDERVALSMPMVMVSTSMQGGCTCENASLLRVGTGNIEFASLFAPKPQIMNCANDWTRAMADKGFPDIEALYKLVGAKGKVKLIRGEHFRHNYNYVTRAQMYLWVNTHFKLGHKTPIIEQDFQFRTQDELTVWDDQHPKPADGVAFEKKFVKYLTKDNAKVLKVGEQSPKKFREVYGSAWDVMLGRTFAGAGKVEWDLKDKETRDDYIYMAGNLRNITHEEELPVLWLYPKQWANRTTIWLSEKGKSGVYDGNGGLIPEVRQLLASGHTVVSVDLLFQGDFLKDGQPVRQTRKVENTREFAGYTQGYNSTLFARRAHDVMTVVTFVDNYTNHGRRNEVLNVVALDGTGPIAAAARASAGTAINRLAIDTAGFRFAKLLDYRSPGFIPGGAKYGDVPGLIALNAPHATWVTGEKRSTLAGKIYGLAKASDRLTVSRTRSASAAVKWLLED